MVGRADGISKDLGLAVETREDAGVRGQLLPRLGNLVKVELEGEQHRAQALSVPLPVRAGLREPRHQQPRGHLPLHLLAGGAAGLVLGGGNGQGEGRVLALGPVDEGVVDEGLQERQERLAAATEDAENVLARDTKQALRGHDNGYSGTSNSLKVS